MKKLWTIVCAGALLLALGACGAQPGAQSSQSGSSSNSQQSSVLEEPIPAQSGDETQTKTEGTQTQPQDAQPDPARVVTLYIGADGQFQQYQETYQGELNDLGMVPAEGVVAEMAQLTGWNLDLAGEITTGKGGITVPFGENCALFTGPPEEQKDEFHMYSTEQLCYTIFDSVKKTLQENFSPADPSALDVYFCTDGSQEIVIENLGITLPIDTPYSHAMFEQLLMSATLGAGGETEAAPVG